MRSKERILLILVTAFVFALMPFVALADNQTSSTELDHSDYGMDGWVGSFDIDPNTPGVQLEGDAAYGYYTGLNPGFNGLSGGWIYDGIAAIPLGAPSYTTPCPDFEVGTYPGTDDILTNSIKNCEANIDSDEPQTEPAGATGIWAVPIVDDMLAKMWDYTAINDRLTQTLDILFVIDPKTEKEGIIDQTLDQDLADYTGGAESSYISAGGVGIINRLTQRFGMENILAKTAALNPGGALGQISANNGSNDADYIDQWLLSYTKDVVLTPGQAIGIVSSYSSWFGLDRNVEPICDSCTYTYDLGHDAVNKTVPEIDQHPNDDVPYPVP